MTKQNKNLILVFLLISIGYISFKNTFNSNSTYANNGVDSNECTFEELELERYLGDIAQKESSNKYYIVSKYGYLGKYQFSMSTLRGIGYDVSKTEFLQNPIIQDEAMLDLLKYNKKRLQKYIDKWDGKKYNGKVITESGILAAAHLGGAESVKRYFKHGVNVSDTLGTTVSYYMNQFSGYKIQI
jgi:hypothetical protein